MEKNFRVSVSFNVYKVYHDKPGHLCCEHSTQTVSFPYPANGPRVIYDLMKLSKLDLLQYNQSIPLEEKQYLGFCKEKDGHRLPLESGIVAHNCGYLYMIAYHGCYFKVAHTHIAYVCDEVAVLHTKVCGKGEKRIAYTIGKYCFVAKIPEKELSSARTHKYYSDELIALDNILCRLPSTCDTSMGGLKIPYCNVKYAVVKHMKLIDDNQLSKMKKVADVDSYQGIPNANELFGVSDCSMYMYM